MNLCNYFIVGKLSNLCNFDVVCRNATIVAIKLLIEAIYISNGTRWATLYMMKNFERTVLSCSNLYLYTFAQQRNKLARLVPGDARQREQQPRWCWWLPCKVKLHRSCCICTPHGLSHQDWCSDDMFLFSLLTWEIFRFIFANTLNAIVLKIELYCS